MSPEDEKGIVDDVAVFPVSNDNTPKAYLSLARNAPAIGTKVWLVAPQPYGDDEARPMQSATIVAYQNGLVLFAYDDPKVAWQETSGAPIGDATGQVVGLNLGGYYDSDLKTVVGTADDVIVIAKAVSATKSN